MRTSRKSFSNARKTRLSFRNYLPHMVLAAILMAVPLFIAAATNGIIKGTVTDGYNNLPVFGASIQIEGTSLGAKTDANGKFVITNISPGTYNLSVSCVRYDPIKVLDIDVISDSMSIIDLTLNRSDIDACNKVKDEKPVVTHLQIAPNEAGKTEMETRSKKGSDENFKVASMPFQSGRVQPCIIAVPHQTPPPPPYYPPPAHGGSAVVNGQAYDAMFFQNYGVNPFVDTEDDHLSTFAADVDDASYVLTRSYLERGELPPVDAIRVEEFVNHFKYHYTSPAQGPFAVYIEGAPSQSGRNSELLRIGIKGMEVRRSERQPANLTFVIDCSGSMNREDRLELVKRSLTYLVDQLKHNDRVGIVMYNTSAAVVLESTPAEYRNLILDAIYRLYANGSTNAEAGLRLGFQMAARHLDEEGTNRVILCSDGVANVGNTDSETLLAEIKRYGKMGITLSTVGVGMGNYNDVLLEQLADKGNGKYAYVDDLAEARRIFVENLTGNLQVIARDVKIQVDFNPAVVRSWRLVGYENRDVADDKFRDNREDGGEVGAGHEVTALYELKLHDHRPSGDIGTVHVRYKDSDTFRAAEFSRTISKRDFAGRYTSASTSFRLAAVASEFAEMLKKSYWAKGTSPADLREEIDALSEEGWSSEMGELRDLIDRANRLWEDRAEQ
ncbi:MAG: von Willebrand factor type A domain-containing protein [candidate division Zixibacteria bacterium]|nr:von Willebrand factor type A domain-containing protein [candidate division Zixibacteria bacterium]